MLNKLTTSRRTLLSIAVFTLAGITLWRFDFAILAALKAFDSEKRDDLYYLLRVWGSKWTWIALTIILSLQLNSIRATQKSAQSQLKNLRRRFRVPKEALYLLLSSLISGGLAEVLKLTIRRLRPSDVDVYLFRAFSDGPFSAKDLGMPSSHAATAFGGTFALITLFPALRWPALALAVGCGLTRVVSGAHYPTDVLGGALVGLVVSHYTASWLRLTPQTSE